jgi:hypothetical protein
MVPDSSLSCSQEPVNGPYPNQMNRVKFQVLKAASMKMAVFWVVARCNLVEVCRRFRGAYCLHHQGSEWAARLTYRCDDGGSKYL